MTQKAGDRERALLAAICRARRLTMSEWAWLNRLPLDEVMAWVGKDEAARQRVGRQMAERIENAMIDSARGAGLQPGSKDGLDHILIDLDRDGAL